MSRPAPTGYSIVKLNQVSDESWAVIELPSGAIALDVHGGLIFRLSKGEAREIERAMTAHIEDVTTPITERYKTSQVDTLRDRLVLQYRAR